MIVLAIESSCDETSASVSKDGRRILSNVVFSQVDLHGTFGGVVPEIASREHIKRITAVIDRALEEAAVSSRNIDLVAVTKGPGLIGSLLVGINAAKAFAYANGIPFIGVHHLSGHIYANNIDSPLVFPLLALIVSGGHTELILMREHFQFEKLGQTHDDAVGEAYDKIARVLELGYPGGPVIDRLASEGTPRYPMPVIKAGGEYDFSYSGLKSHVINLIHNERQRGREIDVRDMAASFQEAAVDHLIKQSRKAFDDYNADMFLVAGGVAANRHLRRRVEEVFNDVDVSIPRFEYCTDNAAMMGIAGYYKYNTLGTEDALDMNGHSRLPFYNQ